MTMTAAGRVACALARAFGAVMMLAVLAAAPQSPSSLTDALARAATYLADYHTRVATVVMEEDYEQRQSTVTPGQRELMPNGQAILGGPRIDTESRRLMSDVLVIGMAADRWITLRDVFAVDGKPVRDRDERLLRLFMTPSENTATQATRIMTEGARFNIYPTLNRTINAPFTVLAFLLSANQSRSTFSLDGSQTIDGVPAVVVKFTERATPRLLRSDSGSAASGRFWIEPASGRVVRTELAFTTTWVASTRQTAAATIGVVYAEDPRLHLWLPATMDERYTLGAVTITGHARYSKTRQFSVDTSANVKPPSAP